MTKETVWPNYPVMTRRRAALAVAGCALSLGGCALALAGQSRSGVARAAGSGESPTATPLPVETLMSDSLPAPDWSGLEAGPQVRITSVVDGDTVELERGPDVRMVGVQAPKLPLGRDHVREWPLAQTAKAQLEALLEGGGRDAQLYFGGRRRDRHGRHLAHIVLSGGPSGGIWLQGAMVLAGLARVYTFADNRSLIPQLLLREHVARSQESNIWTHPYYAVRDARDVADLLERTNHFELVEGVVLNVAAHRARWYLNFGQTWREDFTVTIDREHDSVFEESEMDIAALEGAPIRVRGWVLEDGGPLIRVDHPETIELLANQPR